MNSMYSLRILRASPSSFLFDRSGIASHFLRKNGMVIEGHHPVQKNCGRLYPASYIDKKAGFHVRQLGTKQKNSLSVAVIAYYAVHSWADLVRSDTTRAHFFL